MNQSLPKSAVAGIIAVVVLIVIVLVWHALSARSAPPGGSASAQQALPDLQKNPNPQDLAKQYGYKYPSGR